MTLLKNVQCSFAPKRCRFFVNLFLFTLLIPILFWLNVSPAISQESNEVIPDFKDVSKQEGDLYYDHILRLSKQGVIVGDVIQGIPIGIFRPYDVLLRSEFSKLVAIIRLSEKWGIAEGWQKLALKNKTIRVFEHIRPYLNCQTGACEKIGGKPFPDVTESPSDCIDSTQEENGEEKLSYCNPWYGGFVYFGVEAGFFKGYDTGYFGSADDILRLHAIKTMIINNGHLTPEQDERYQALNAKALVNQSFAPKCIGDAKNYILDLNGGNTEDANKLYQYAALADRLDIFGNECQVFTESGANTPIQRALFLQGSLTRQEAARYFSFTSLYQPTQPSAAEDSTLNTAQENEGTAASNESYEEPDYEPTDIWQQIEEMSQDEEKRQELLDLMGKEAVEEMLMVIEEKEKLKEKEITEPKETIVENPFEEENPLPENTLLIDGKTYLLWDELSEEEKETLKNKELLLDIIQEEGKFYINADQLLSALPNSELIKAPSLTLENRITACMGSVCIKILPGELLTLFGVQQEGDAFFQNISYKGDLYRISCETLRSAACLEAMAKKHSGRCCAIQDLQGTCPIVEYEHYTIEDRPSNQMEGDDTIWYKATKWPNSCYIPFQDLLYGHKEEGEKSWVESLFGLEKDSCSASLLQTKMIEKYAVLNKGSTELEQMIREIWNSETPDGFRFYMQIGLDTARHQSKILKKMIDQKNYPCSDFWFEFMGLYAGHITASLRHFTNEDLAKLPLLEWFGLY